MVLWQSDLRVSWQAQRLSLVLHGVAMMALLLAPWPNHYTLVWIVLLILVVRESVRSQYRISRCEGAIALLLDRQLYWRNQRWNIIGRPWVGQQAILLTLRSESGEREHLWLMQDSMSTRDWRRLHMQLLNVSAKQ
ncbi:toxin CptA [Izhakiella capsodis]|uniref:Toxin CptA n=1 Tax=Izhakiella capsodis TaxID=1367852 RepID=A0A1I4W3Q2_9GAMM|nr:protein YgfX [Izhakiella capsodis]SFN08115.1 toxin CptA [Izhakiella capsodis]